MNDLSLFSGGLRFLYVRIYGIFLKGYLPAVPKGGQIEALLVPEMIIDGGDVDAGLPAYLADGGALEAVGDKDLARGLQYPLFRVSRFVILLAH
ncbi:MAG TPA: hypothetical protein PLX02_02570 [Syntrophorhabdaceae bacterium]|nr:hypothetical protein [Syntrophorhabdaceae bacterium]